MNFLLIIIYGYVILAIYIGYIIWRDRQRAGLFFSRHFVFSKIILICLIFSIILAFYATLIEPFSLKTKKINLTHPQINNIKIAYFADLQVGRWKKEAWVNKIVNIINKESPDLVLIGGDLIDNFTFNEEEVNYLNPLKKLSDQYPVFYIFGNHEYGIGGKVKDNPNLFAGNQSEIVKKKMTELNIILLKDNLSCLTLKNQSICLYGIDDIWKTEPTFKELENWDQAIPLIYLTHNPDGVLYFNKEIKPILTLAGHTHAGQIYLPFLGPLGDAVIDLGKDYYYGLKYFNDFLIYITSGTGESSAPIRFLAQPEIVIIKY